ncbi:Uncharacterized protein Fot_04853 [Forsythia ovata]|uniref:Uncharacterized protein n=1 Tax=Forsythia ovata TaxID=205694 RepID=A0ABD1WNG8_9LAMI
MALLTLLLHQGQDRRTADALPIRPIQTSSASGLTRPILPAAGTRVLARRQASDEANKNIVDEAKRKASTGQGNPTSKRSRSTDPTFNRIHSFLKQRKQEAEASATSTEAAKKEVEALKVEVAKIRNQVGTTVASVKEFKERLQATEIGYEDLAQRYANLEERDGKIFSLIDEVARLKSSLEDSLVEAERLKAKVEKAGSEAVARYSESFHLTKLNFLAELGEEDLKGDADFVDFITLDPTKVQPHLGGAVAGKAAVQPQLPTKVPSGGKDSADVRLKNPASASLPNPCGAEPQAIATPPCADPQRRLSFFFLNFLYFNY